MVLGPYTLEKLSLEIYAQDLARSLPSWVLAIQLTCELAVVIYYCSRLLSYLLPGSRPRHNNYDIIAVVISRDLSSKEGR